MELPIDIVAVRVPGSTAPEDGVVPEISRFLGIVITMHYDDHAPPHFHVRYSERKATVSIHPVELLSGKLPPRVLGLVTEWAARHSVELEANWSRARRQVKLRRIAPLE